MNESHGNHAHHGHGHGKEKKNLLGAASMALIFLALFLIMQTLSVFKEYKYIGTGINPTNTITVSGEGEIFQIPDVAVFTLSVQEEQDTVEKAQESATTKINDVIAYLESEGVAEKDIQTTNYNVNPRYEYPEVQCFRAPCPRAERTLVGYEVSQGLRIKVRDTDMAGALLAGVGSRGVSNVSSLSFEIDDLDTVQAAARRDAIADAKEKAQILAKDLGVKIVRVVQFSESGNRYEGPEFAYALAANDSREIKVAPSIPVGENKTTINVSVTYEIR